jgi:site-specific DNA-methyltransferase (adenine-specific)
MCGFCGGGITTSLVDFRRPSEVLRKREAEKMKYALIEGDCLDVLQFLPAESIKAIVCDPPYGIGFMGKDWDCAVPGDEFAQLVFRVLKPGGHIIAFAATRTVHRLTVALENAGLEIRDQIAWVNWQGFPKSHNVSMAIDKHFGAERVVVGEKNNGIAGGTGRHAGLSGSYGFRDSYNIAAPSTPEAKHWDGYGTALKPAYEPAVLARKPLDGTVANNVLKHGTGGLNIDGCRFAYGDTAWPGPSGDVVSRGNNPKGGVSSLGTAMKGQHDNPVSEIGRFPANLYQCPKPSRGERDGGVKGGNTHPTVKPAKLMAWLCTLIGGQKGDLILDPFMGSGSTGIGALKAGFNFVGIEKSGDYVNLARSRIKNAAPL